MCGLLHLLLWWSGGTSLLLRALVKQKVKRHFTVFTYATAAVFTYATAAVFTYATAAVFTYATAAVFTYATAELAQQMVCACCHSATH
jgi:hypothetical protein